MYTEDEMRWILERLGYEIIKDKGEHLQKSRKRFYLSKGSYMVKYEDKILPINDVFKKELTKRLFKLDFFLVNENIEK